MGPDTLQVVLSGAARLLAPAYWLVAGLDWPGGAGPRQAAWAIAPDLVPRDEVSNDAYQMLGCAHLYAGRHSARIVFFSDLTRMLASAGASWASLGVDWHAALKELQAGPYPAMVLTISERSHATISDPTSWSADYAEERDRSERERVRLAVADKLTGEWPGYMGGVIEARRHLAPASMT